MINIDWQSRGPSVLLQLFDVNGAVRIEKRIAFAP